MISDSLAASAILYLVGVANERGGPYREMARRCLDVIASDPNSGVSRALACKACNQIGGEEWPASDDETVAASEDETDVEELAPLTRPLARSDSVEYGVVPGKRGRNMAEESDEDDDLFDLAPLPTEQNSKRRKVEIAP